MRPLELRLRNFRSYFGEDAVFDFRDRGLVGVVGPIGSGKSSLLDAIAFALFGRTPTVASTTKSLIHQRAEGATVSLRFSVDDEVWEVTRALRRKGQSVHGLQRLSSDSADAVKLESAVLEADVNRRIVDLLGLEFDGFSRSIMLAQGRFAEFLSARPAERDKVLKGVFGHERIDAMRSAAKDRAAAEGIAVETLDARLEAAESLTRRIAESDEKLAMDGARLELLRKAEPEFADFTVRREAADRVIAHAETRLAELTPLAGRIPAPDIVAAVVEVAHNAAETRQRLGKGLEDAQAGLAATEAALALLDPAATRGLIEEATRLEATIAQVEAQQALDETRRAAQEKLLESARRDLADAEARLVATMATLDEARAIAASAAEAKTVAEQQLHDARHGDMAGTLRAQLAVGEACPVCEQSVATVPPARKATQATSEAEDAVARAEHDLAKATKGVELINDDVAKLRIAVGTAGAEVKAASRELEAVVARLAADAAHCAESKEKLRAVVGAASASELRKSLETAEVAVTDARKRVDLARREHDEAIRAAQAADKELSGLRLSLIELAAKLGLALGDTDDSAAVSAAVADARTAWSNETETLATAKVAAEQERSEVAAAVQELRSELGIEGDFAAALAQVGASVELRSQQIAADRAELALSDELRAERLEAGRRCKVYETLTVDLTDSRFVRYLLDEEKRDLANLGSEHFERLSSGRYRFSTEGEFRVVDLTSADAVRKADSLSGGETFLASLALALALAEMVARTGGRLDAFFLDEGFGSLDAEHLDLAMDGIERLAAGEADRLVLVVSHVPDMRNRLEDLIELDRHPVTGDTIVLHG